MKKWISLILLTMVLGTAGCNSRDTKDDRSTGLDNGFSTDRIQNQEKNDLGAGGRAVRSDR